MKATMGDTINTLLLLQVSTRLLLWPIREVKVDSISHNNGLPIRVLDLLFHPQLHQIEVGLPGEPSGGSRGFLLVLKNYPFSELKTFFIALYLLKRDQIVSELLRKFHCISRTL